MQQELFIDPQGRLMISKQHLLLKGIYTEVSYRNQKSKGRLEDVKMENGRYVFVDSLTSVTKAKVIEKFANLKNEYSQLLRTATNAGEDCAPMAVEFTAESLQINEPFIRSTIESYMSTHYTLYTASYLDLGLHSNSVKGYAKQCALVQWMFDFVSKIQTSEVDMKRCEVLVRSFRMNLLTSISKIEFEVKIPRSETRFNKWFDDVLTAMDKGKRPQDIIQPKRMSNENASKVTDEQFRIAAFWHINGVNMSIANLYKKWKQYGQENGWWMDENGKYNPPTEARLYQLLAPLKNPNRLEKTDGMDYYLNTVPTATRDLPTKKNHVWVIDGTAQNENVEFKGKVRQHIYAIKVADVSTLRMVGVSTLIGVKEPFYAVKEAIMMGIIETGYKPAIIHCDHGPSYKELERWCEQNEIRLYASRTGNARAKTIESLFNMFDNDITKFMKGFSGMNRTATGSINSKPSDSRETKGKHAARSASIAMEWAKTEGMKSWNERVIETLEKKPCNKTPFEMWDEKESYVPKLSYSQLCMMCGTLHERKLTITGLEVGHDGKDYCYFPSIETPDQRAFADRIFTYTPMDASTANKLKIYILKGGDPAPVFSHDGKYLGIWGLKVNTAYIAETKEEKKVLSNIMALQYRVQETAKAINADIKQQVSMHPDYERIEELGNEMLTGKRRTYVDFEKRIEGRYDKSALLLDEIEAKEAPRYKEIVDPDTGEIHRIELN
jgi:hypothetical protein